MAPKLCFILMTFFFHKLNGYSGGAPSSVCDDQNMKPQHQNSVFQSTLSPYSVVINSCNISHCSVKIEGKSKFKGMLLRAVDANNKFIGSFINVNSMTKLTCSNGALTHNQALSVNQLQANWIVGTFTGRIQFRATILEEYSIFWNIKSDPYDITGSFSEATSIPPAPHLITSSQTPLSPTSDPYDITGSVSEATSIPPASRLITSSDRTIITSAHSSFGTSSLGVDNSSTSSQTPLSSTVSHIKTCPASKGCFLCSNQECVVTWSQGKSNYVDFQISSKAANDNRYVAIAFSTDTKMGDDSIILCSKSTNSFTVELWYSVGKRVERASNPQESLDSDSFRGLYSDGWMSCVFSKQIKRVSSVAKRNSDLVYYLDGQLYYLLFATGPMIEGNPQVHDYKTFSSEALNFTDFQTNATGSGSSSNSLVKAHGILMVIAWLMMASVSILLPRYFKSAWPDKKILNKPIWFPVHQTLMVLVLILTAIAFIIIFSEAQGYAESSNYVAMAHPPLGIIIMILVFANPVMSLFRCSPDDERRWIFNYFHTMVGEFVLIIAVVNIFLSFFMPKANIGFWVIWVMVALVCWHAFIEFLLIMYERYLQSKTLNIKQHQDNLGMELDEPQASPINNISVIKSILIASQWIGVTGLAIAVCVGIGVA